MAPRFQLAPKAAESWTERLNTSSGTSQLLNANTSTLCSA